MSWVMVFTMGASYIESMPSCHDMPASAVLSVSSFFLLGLFGSVHCLGMCSPLSIFYTNPQRPVNSHLMYQASRAGSYLLIALLLSTLGQGQLNRMPTHRISALLGVAVTALVIFQFFQTAWGKAAQHTLMKRLFQFNSRIPLPFRSIGVGLFTGLLPCGLLVPAYLGASALPPLYAGIGMAMFFIGTLPSLVVGQASIHALKRKIPLRTKYVDTGLTGLFLLFQIWMITR